MFEQLQDRLAGAIRQLKGQGRLTETNISDSLRAVRMALLEADVALPVAKAFIDQVREQAMGQKVLESLNPGQAVIKIVYDELVALMGVANEGLNLAVRPPAVMMVAGLQGAGKTTTVAKLARRLHEREKKKVLLASADIYRPAAIDQLERLAEDVGAGFFRGSEGATAVAIATAAVEQASRVHADVVLIDTAGRLHVDEAMMDEIKALHEALNPVETLFVVDSMTGQDAVHSAQAFNEILPLTGVVLTKTDGDARGGAALSVRQVTGKPIKFMGVGEKTDALEVFHPERLASRILGMGDVLSLVEEAQHQADKKQTERLTKKLKTGKGFDLDDLREQLAQMEKMGGMASMLDKLPAGMGLPQGAASQLDAKQNMRMIAIIDSMTPHERCSPDIVRASRKRRIAQGSGTQVQDVNRLLKQFVKMQKMMKRMGKGGMAKMARAMGGKIPGMPAP
ncbi:MAG TPA: signal recognition particle protein [Acidiferrobacteraceae bacterium]|nr:signal recognition particle protein [Acidiferrobacteraceae bacterium]